MKKVSIIIFLAGLILIVSSFYAISYMEYIKVKNTNNSIQEKIDKIVVDSKKEDDDNITLNEELKELEKSLTKEINEYDAWQKTKEKLNSIISS